jgi:hypothetical protein
MLFQNLTYRGSAFWSVDPGKNDFLGLPHSAGSVDEL